MDCHTFENKMVSFIRNNGNIKGVSDFIKHLESCESCRKDFEADFYAYRGLEIFNDENLDKYDLQKDMYTLINDSKNRIRRYKYSIWSFIIFLLVSVGVIVYLSLI